MPAERVRLRAVDRPLFATAKPGRFWKRSAAHKVRTVELRLVGLEAQGMPTMFFAMAFTECGGTIDSPQLTHVDPAGPRCGRCFR